MKAKRRGICCSLADSSAIEAIQTHEGWRRLSHAPLPVTCTPESELTNCARTATSLKTNQGPQRGKWFVKKTKFGKHTAMVISIGRSSHVLFFYPSLMICALAPNLFSRPAFKIPAAAAKEMHLVRRANECKRYLHVRFSFLRSASPRLMTTLTFWPLT